MKCKTVDDIIHKYNEEGRIHLKHSPGCPKIILPHEARTIIRKIKKGSKLSALKIVSQVFAEFYKKVWCQLV